ncbi:MAG: hypothetical protein RL189_360 [Pseudomonadota bacterium]|jgi:hypothetical protein
MTEKDTPPNFQEEFSSFKNDLYFPDAAILRPTWDRAFKAIFLRNRDLTLRFVNDFFEFESPITELTFLSTEIEPQGDAAKSVRLDIALKLADGTLIDLEMQTSRKSGYLRRCVFYNAALLVAHTKMGASHDKKEYAGPVDRKSTRAKKKSAKKVSKGPKTQDPQQNEEKQFQPNVISLTLLNDHLSQKDSEKFRHSYQLMDGGEYLDKDCFRIDVIELPKLRKAQAMLPERQRLWIRLFLAQTYAEVIQLTQEEPLFSLVCKELEMVSRDKKMKDRARMIWEGEFAVRHEIASAKKEIREELQREMRAELQREAAEANAKVIQTLSTAVRALASTGQTPEAIAALLNLPLERVSEILHATESKAQSKE